MPSKELESCNDVDLVAATPSAVTPSAETEDEVESDAGDGGISRRTLLASGVGLAAAACTPGGQQETAAPARDVVRDSSRVLGHIAERAGQQAAAEAAAAAVEGSVLPTYFRLPSEMPVTAEANQKRVVLNVDYMDHIFVKRDGTIVRGRVRAYNNHVPGPTIRCSPGDRLNITLKNNLPADEDFAYDYEGCRTVNGNLTPSQAGLPHAFNTTNLHTHGLHVSPTSLCGNQVCAPPPYQTPPTLASDDVFVEIPPGATQEYCIVLPDFHAPGTHWYHAHKHGSTSLQVNNGLVGALIVSEVGGQRILGNRPHEDQIFLMQEIMEVDDGNDQLVYAQTRGDTSKFFINGVFQPRLRMRTGEIQRWRFINATSRPRGLAKLRLVKQGQLPLLDTSDLPLPIEHARNLEQQGAAGLAAQPVQPSQDVLDRIRRFQLFVRENAHPIYLIAVDGISLYGKPPREVLEWDFAPGNRVDFLVKVDQPGLYRVVKDLHPYAGRSAPEVQTLAFVEVTEGANDMEMPATIPGQPPCYLDPIAGAETKKTVDFQATGAGNWNTVCATVPVPWVCANNEIVCDGTTRQCNPPSPPPPAPPLPPLVPRIFAMDCARFDPNNVEAKYTMELNTVEEWTLRNLDGGAHPFHIHVNPFQVIEIFDPTTGQTTTFDPQEALWQDTVALPLPSGTTASYIKIRHRFLTYPGDFVIHCHFLNHEDLGMMKRVRVVATPNSPGHRPCEPVQNCFRRQD